MNRALADYWRLADQPVPPVRLVHDVDVLPSALATTELAVGAVAAAATSAALLSRQRGGPLAAASVDGRRVSASFRSDRLFRLNGEPIDGFAELSGFWRTSDGWVRTHANYPHHRARLLGALSLPESTGARELAAALRTLRASDVERSVQAAGGICVAVRSREQWREHPQARAIADVPLVAWTRIADAPARELPPPPIAPLLPAAGLRVLDLTRVIAGPVATRTLALLGADVLRLDSPRLPEIPWQHLDTGMGKRSALLALDADPDAFEALLADADVVVVGYRPGAMDRFGLSPAALAERRPGLVVATLSAWGGVGPWGGNRGFDSIVQAATGIALAESTDRPDAGANQGTEAGANHGAEAGAKPGALPAQALDHATGYLLAATILTAVARQIREGGSWHVRAHLAVTARWLLDHVDDARRALPDVDDILRQRDTASGVLRYPPPAVQIEDGPDDWDRVGSPWGVDPAQWLS